MDCGRKDDVVLEMHRYIRFGGSIESVGAVVYVTCSDMLDSFFPLISPGRSMGKLGEGISQRSSS